MSLSQLANFYESQPEPNKGIFLFLKSYLCAFDERISEKWKYKLPFFYFNDKMFCYLWKDSKTSNPYLSFANGYKVTHPKLDQGNRKLFKAFHIDPNIDIDLDSLNEILHLMRDFALEANRH